MASTTSKRERSFQPERADMGENLSSPVAPPAPSVWGRRIVIALVLLAVLAGGAWGAVYLISTQVNDPYADMLTASVRRADLVVMVTEDGNLESAVNIDIKCEVAGGAAILWIVEDGTEVKKGDKLVELDSAALEEQINQQRITYEKARAAKIQAEKDYDASKLAVEEYKNGTYVKEVQDQDALMTIALENLRSAENTLAHAERMFRKGYISELDLETQRFSVQRAKLELESAKTSKEVLVKYTKVKTNQELESKRDSAEAQMKSEDASFALEESRLKRLESQLQQSVILAPADGMVVYANEQRGRYGGSQQAQIEEGAMVRERQTILRLPELSKMQVKVNVHESKIEMLGRALKKARSEGRALPARIRILDRTLVGSLIGIANQPEPSGWWTGNVKEYATTISIDGTPEGLRPGMTAECQILVERREDVLVVPVAAVVEQRGGYACWVKTATGVERRPMVLGATNDQFVEVSDGVKEGEDVVLNPRAMIKEARAVKESAAKEDVFGDQRGKELRKKKMKGPTGPPGEKAGRGSKSPHAGPAAAGPGAAGPGAAGHRGKKRGSFSLKTFDKDGDGKISKEEAPGQMKNFFDTMDGNGDGFVDQAEFNKARQRMRGGGRPN